jgi:hypothetical protein
MLLTLVRESGSTPPPGASGAVADDEGSPRLPFDQGAKSFTIEVPYSPQGAGVLAQVLLSWRLAKPGRAVFLMLPDEPELEIGLLSPSRIEWMLPVVTRIAIIERHSGSRQAPPED